MNRTKGNSRGKSLVQQALKSGTVETARSARNAVQSRIHEHPAELLNAQTKRARSQRSSQSSGFKPATNWKNHWVLGLAKYGEVDSHVAIGGDFIPSPATAMKRKLEDTEIITPVHYAKKLRKQASNNITMTKVAAKRSNRTSRMSRMAAVRDTTPQRTSSSGRRNPSRGGAPSIGGGIMNLGNTCYQNAVTQILLGMPAFAQELADVERIRSSFPNTVVAALSECISARLAGQTIDPSRLREAMGRHNAVFLSHQQQDAHEFFCSILDAVSKEMGVDRAAFGEVGMCEKPLMKDPAEVFSFTVEHKLTCRCCGHHSTKEEKHNHLSLDMADKLAKNQTNSIDAMISSFFKEESVEKHCEKCSPSVNQVHKLEHHIKQMPEVLAMHIKRFQHVVGRNGSYNLQKINDPFEIPRTVGLKRVCSADVVGPHEKMALDGKENLQGFSFNKPSYNYSLVGAVNHHGHQAMFGHYTATVATKEAGWVRYDDAYASVVPAGAISANQREPYMLFFAQTQ